MKSGRSFLLSLMTILCGILYAADWSYQGTTGPAYWSGLDKDFIVCKTGKDQSPVNISTRHVEKAQLPAIQLAFPASKVMLVNNDHIFEVDLMHGAGVTIGTDYYQFVRFHFHTPSENEVNGRRFPIEGHLVLQDKAGHLAVLAVFFKQGQQNTKLNVIFNNLPTEANPKVSLDFNPADLLPANLSYYMFAGSLTTPPCTEGLTWYVLKQPVELSKEQIKAFQRIFKKNARPVQPLNHRVIKMSI